MTDRDRSRQVRRIFDEALDLEPEERREFVERACAGNEALRDEALSLLEARDEAGEFLDSGPPEALLREALPGDAPDPRVGTTIGGYRVTEVVARGGMGVVYRAEQDNPRRLVALKLMAPGVFDPALVRRFEVEARVLGHLHHPGIAQIFEAGTDEAGHGPQPFFAMEWVDGLTLREHAERNELRVRERVELVIQVCAAVQHAHQRGVIHRDLKPANILVDAEGRPKVLDFGIARMTDADTRQATAVTGHGELLGTLAYMSPEQVQGDPDEIDTRSDVYTLGVVLYELLAGRLPHDLEGKPLTEAIRIVAESESRPLPAEQRFSSDLRRVVATALATDRDRRYGSAAELAADLGRYIDDQPIQARPPSTAYQLRKLVARNRLASAFAAALVIALVVAGIALAVQNRRINAAMERANEEAATAHEVSGFLEGLFRISDPNRTKGATVTARELLDRGADRIERDLGEQPTVQRRLMRTMASAYASLGLSEDAIPLLERALDRTPETEIDERVVLLSRLAWEYRRAGDLPRALELARDASDLASTGANPDASTALALITIGIMLRDQGEFPRAIGALENALRIRESNLGPDHEDVGHALYHLGWAQHLHGLSEEARRTYERACPIFERENGDHHSMTAWCYNDFGSVLSRLGELDEAEGFLARSLEIRREILPPGHPDLIASANNLASLYYSAGDLVRSRDAYAELVEMNRARYDDSHPNVWNALRNLAFAEERLGNLDDCERILREVLAITAKPDIDPRARAQGLGSLGFYLFRRERGDEAEPLVREALAILSASAGPTSSAYASYLYQFGTGLAAEADRLDDARAMLEEYVSIREGEEQPNVGQIGRARTHLGRLAVLGGQFDAACEWLEAALPMVVEARGEVHANVADAAFWLATCRAMQGRDDEATTLYDRSIAIREQLVGADDPNALFARACRAAGRGDAARTAELLREALDTGFRVRLVGLYPHFAAHRDDPTFAALLARLADPPDRAP